MRVLSVTSLESLSIVPEFSVRVLLATSLDSLSDFFMSQSSV